VLRWIIINVTRTAHAHTLKSFIMPAVMALNNLFVLMCR